MHVPLEHQWYIVPNNTRASVPFGHLKHVKNGKEGQVYVTHVIKGSLSDECLIVGDRILQIDGVSINDKEMAKKIIVKGLLSGNVMIIVERPDSPTARNFASEVLSVRTPPIIEKLK